MQKFLSISEKLLFWLIVFLLIFIPLYPKFPLLNIKGTFVAIRIEDLLIALVIGIWLVTIIYKRQVKELLKDKLNQALLLFFGIGLLSVFSAIFLTNTVEAHLAILHFLRRVELMLLLPVVLYTIKTKRQVIICLFTLAGVVLLVNLYALGQQYLNWPVISTTNSEFSKGLILYLTPGARVNSTFAGHYDLATFLMMALILMSSIFFYAKKIYYKAIIAIISALSFFVLVLTAARFSVAALFVSVLLVILLSGKKILILILIVLSLIGVLYPSQLRDRFISVITININQGGERYVPKDNNPNSGKVNISTLPVEVPSPTPSKISNQATTSATPSAKIASDIAPGEPIDSTQLGAYRSFSIRLNLEWPRAIRAFAKNPFLGTGYSSIGIATDNDFLRSIGEVGLLGTIAFGLIFIVIFKRLWSLTKKQDRLIKFLSIGVISIVVGFLLNGLAIDVFEASKVATLFWILLGISLAHEKA